MAPAATTNGEQLRASGNVSTAERRGDALRLAWKKTLQQ
jgi:hypothetical protein